MLGKLARLVGVWMPPEKLLLPDPLYFWAAVESPVVIETPEYAVVPLFSSEESANRWYRENLARVKVEGGPHDGAAKEFRGGRLDTVRDLQSLFEMVRDSEYAAEHMTIDPPGPGENFPVTRTDEFLAYARERSETLYFEGKL
jgi:hypothetical protein